MIANMMNEISLKTASDKTCSDFLYSLGIALDL